MTTRRALLKAAGLAPLGGLAVGGLALGGCGVGPFAGGSAAQLVRADLARAGANDLARAAAVAAVTAFTADVYRELSSLPGNLICSPHSIATALAMTVQGAKGVTAQEILSALHLDSGAGGAVGLADGMNAIDLALAGREVEYRRPDGGTERVELRSANSLWGQRDVSWGAPFLEVLARDFGTGMRVVDYRGALEPARQAINAWVSEQTHERIPALIDQDVLTDLTRLVLVNALYFKAGWRAPFQKADTSTAPFTRLDGSRVDVDLMHGDMSGTFTQGPGWVAASLPYATGDLAMAVVLPDRGRFAEVERGLTGSAGAGLIALLTHLSPQQSSQQVVVGLPRWTARSQVDLLDTLAALGIRTALSDAADLSGMTADVPLKIGAAVHEGWIAVDEDGTQAAAATALVGVATSGRVDPPKTLIADRPFLYVVHDVPTRLPFFVGRVLDPTA